MVLEVFTGTLERLACQLHRLFKDIKRYAVLEAVNSVVPSTGIQVYRASILLFIICFLKRGSKTLPGPIRILCEDARPKRGFWSWVILL